MLNLKFFNNVWQPDDGFDLHYVILGNCVGESYQAVTRSTTEVIPVLFPQLNAVLPNCSRGTMLLYYKRVQTSKPVFSNHSTRKRKQVPYG
jgi:hypothetical protein